MATLEQIEQALRAADAAGNTEDARRLAQAYADMRGQQPKADFSNVQSGSGTTETPDSARREQHPIGSFLGEIGGRQVLQGAAGLFGALGGDAINQYVVDPIRRAVHEPTLSGLITGENQIAPSRTYRQAASDFADSVGMRQPQTSGERVASDVGEALTGTALTMGAGSLLGQSSRLGQLLTAQPGLQAVSTVGGAGASSEARESGAGAGTQTLAGLVGALGPGVVGAGAAMGARGAVRGRSGADMRNTIADFNKLGANPSVGQASGNSGVQGLENLLAGGPTSAGVMSRFAERQADDIGGGLQGIANSISRNASAERAGRAIEKGAETLKQNTGATKRALYWQADQFIPESTPVPLSNTWQKVVDLTSPTPGAAATTGAMVNPRIAQLRQTLQQDLSAGNGQIPYSALKRIRSEIGEAIGDYSLVSDVPTREYKALYAALSRDMEAAAQAQGPQAVAAAKRANNYTRAAADRLEQVQRVVDKNGGPERVYNAAMSGTKDGGTTLRAVMQSLPADGQKAVTAAVIKRMGMANPGAQDAAGEAFSAATFLTNWNKVSPEAKRALFDRYGPSFSKDMERIARVADNIKAGSKVFANPSGTANRGAAQAYAIGLPISIAQAPLTGHYWPIVATIGGGIAANVSARALTNPRIVSWLADSTRLPVGSINVSLRALAAEGRKNDDDEVAEFADELLKQQATGAPR